MNPLIVSPATTTSYQVIGEDINGCEDTVTTTITVFQNPTAANAGADQTICQTPGSATLAGNNPAVGAGVWTLTSGTGTITTPASPTSGLTGLGVGANVFTWTTSNGSCPTSSDAVTINVDASPTTSAAGPDQNICIDNAILAGNVATSGAGVWTLISGTGTITTPGSPNTTITGLGNGANVFQWTITNGTCAPSTDQITITVTPDTDGDLICDAVDLDDDNDGIPDTAELPGDSDGDGIPDSLDLDSDNDGIPDIIKAGGTDSDGDGEIDYPVPGDPTSMNDTNNDSLDDGVVGTPLPNPDSDGDGVNDVVDLDADNDGTPDVIEAGGTDGDGTPDDQDLDSDDDGISDIDEGGGVDIDGDGMVDNFTDVDGDGLDDNVGSTPPDTDGDGTPDFQDLDSDNDGVLDADENDPNGDGQGPDDTDGDGIPDYQDTDDDNDGILTADELDLDHNGVYDDCDEDGTPDYLDTDPCTITPPEGFSPNGDGVNDFYVIQGITSYPEANMTIFNRWGNKVYESTNGYANDWDGTNQFGISVGSSDLPVGTYFYVLDLGDGSEVIKGYIYLNK